MKKKVLLNSLYVIVILLLIFGIAANFIKLPYYMTKPGNVYQISKLVTVKNAEAESGSMNMVTVLEGRVNLLNYLIVKYDFNPYTTLYKKNVIQQPDETHAEYEVRVSQYMNAAQEQAKYVAYKAAGGNPDLEYTGILVQNIISEMPAAKELKPGDIILAIDGKTAKTFEKLNKISEDKQEGDTVTLKIKRDGKIIQQKVTIGVFPEAYTPKGVKEKTGIGIIGTQLIDVTGNPPVEFHIKDISGPSAGLMMTLEIYNRLTETDYTYGKKICGTGTINLDGSVGPIGDIKKKVVAADDAGCQIFFAPRDNGDAKSAKKAAEDIDTNMKIVPVSTFEDAKQYLLQLK